jgi:hypothetical protein
MQVLISNSIIQLLVVSSKIYALTEKLSAEFSTLQSKLLSHSRRFKYFRKAFDLP